MPTAKPRKPTVVYPQSRTNFPTATFASQPTTGQTYIELNKLPGPSRITSTPSSGTLQHSDSCHEQAGSYCGGLQQALNDEGLGSRGLCTNFFLWFKVLTFRIMIANCSSQNHMAKFQASSENGEGQRVLAILVAGPWGYAQAARI